jgi:hypothetical protein
MKVKIFLLFVIATNIIESERFHSFPLCWVSITHHRFENIRIKDILRLLQQFKAFTIHFSAQIMHGYSIKVNDSARLQRTLIVESIEPHVHVIDGLRLLLLTDIICRDVVFIKELFRNNGSLAFSLEKILSVRGGKNESFYSTSFIVVIIHDF